MVDIKYLYISKGLNVLFGDRCILYPVYTHILTRTWLHGLLL